MFLSGIFSQYVNKLLLIANTALETFEFGEMRLVKERGDRFGIIGDILCRKR